MIICTSICSNYLPKAFVLAQSVKRFLPDAKFVVCLVEKEVPPYASQKQEFDYVFKAEDIWEGNFNSFIFKHSIVEASTAVKGQLFRFLYNEFPDQDYFVYLDPDIKVYADFPELKLLLQTRPIVLCPHLLEPGNIKMELSSTAHGVYNLGFLAINRSVEAVKFISWWADRLKLYCYDDKANGIFTDQKWVDLAPCFFDVEIFKHKGYDFATWSLLNSNLTEAEGTYYVKGDPLRFIHFSGYDSRTIDWAIDEWLSTEPDSPFRQLYEDYKIDLEQADDGISNTPWSYSCYKSGEKIDQSVRVAYRNDLNLQQSLENPFEYSNKWFLDKFANCSEKNELGLLKKCINYIQKHGFKLFLTKVKYKLLNK